MEKNRDIIEANLNRAEDAIKAAIVEMRDASQAYKLRACLALIESVSAKMWNAEDIFRAGPVLFKEHKIEKA